MVFRKRTGMISLYINGGIIYEQYIWYSIKTQSVRNLRITQLYKTIEMRDPNSTRDR